MGQNRGYHTIIVQVYTWECPGRHSLCRSYYHLDVTPMPLYVHCFSAACNFDYMAAFSDMLQHTKTVSRASWHVIRHKDYVHAADMYDLCFLVFGSSLRQCSSAIMLWLKIVIPQQTTSSIWTSQLSLPSSLLHIFPAMGYRPVSNIYLIVSSSPPSFVLFGLGMIWIDDGPQEVPFSMMGHKFLLVWWATTGPF